MKVHLYKLISGIWLKMGRLWQYTGEYFWAGVEIYFHYFPTKIKQHDKPEKHVAVFSISKRFFCFVLGNICKFGVNAIIKRCSETLEYTESSEVSCHSLVLWHNSVAVPSQIHPCCLVPQPIYIQRYISVASECLGTVAFTLIIQVWIFPCRCLYDYSKATNSKIG